MDITVKAKCEVPAKLKRDAVGRLEHATRFSPRLDAVEMVFRVVSGRPGPLPALVEITARAKGQVIRAEGWGEDHRGAIDIAVTRFERQLARYKARTVNRTRGRASRLAPFAAAGLGASAGAAGEPLDEQEVEERSWPVPRIVRTKRFPLPPMSAEQAAEQLELLGHQFFVFTDAGSGACHVIYRRADGDLGLIEPERTANGH